MACLGPSNVANTTEHYAAAGALVFFAYFTVALQMEKLLKHTFLNFQGSECYTWLGAKLYRATKFFCFISQQEVAKFISKICNNVLACALHKNALKKVIVGLYHSGLYIRNLRKRPFL